MTTTRSLAKEALVKTSIGSVLALSTLLSLGASTSALGAPTEALLVTRVVSYDDLDLSTAGGALRCTDASCRPRAQCVVKTLLG